RFTSLLLIDIDYHYKYQKGVVKNFLGSELFRLFRLMRTSAIHKSPILTNIKHLIFSGPIPRRLRRVYWPSSYLIPRCLRRGGSFRNH
ncbi:MAG: hypothetical protein KKC25_11140, partial [Proteobacteria bacterium]|nr:hypothetical protein [Pseudomonadota bacterium]